MRGFNSEIIHLLRLFNIPSQPDRPCCTIGLTYLIARLQIFGVYPAFILYREGMLRGCFNPLAIQDDFGDNFVRVVNGVGDYYQSVLQVSSYYTCVQLRLGGRDYHSVTISISG